MHFNFRKKIEPILYLIVLTNSAFCENLFDNNAIKNLNSASAIVDSLPLLAKATFNTFYDSIVVKGKNYKLTHFHEVSAELNRKLLFDSSEDVFNSCVNKKSRIIFKDNNGKSFDIATVPLTNIVYLENLGLIIGLSKIVVSPYHIVIYSTEGKLICKRTLNNIELRFNRTELESLLLNYPALKICLPQTVVFKETGNYHLEISKCLLNILGRDIVLNMNNKEVSRYFPYMSSSSGLYSTYYHSFSDSNPINELKMKGTAPYLLILNSEDGQRINIPLSSNCDVNHDMKE